jgi:hypothetical protein
MSIISSIESAASSAKSAITSKIPVFGSKSTSNVDKFKTPSTQAVGNYVYPSDIGSAPDAQHWVTFYINVRGKSKVAREQNLASTQAPVSLKGENRTDPSSMANGQAALNTFNTAKQIVQGKGPIVGIAKTAAKIVGLRAGGGVKGMVVGTLVTAGVVGVGTAVASELLVDPDKTYRIADAITLNVSQPPNVHYTATYDTINMGAVAGFVGGGSMADSVSALDKTKEGTLAVLRAALSKTTGSTTSAAANFEFTNKQSLNPYREVLFKGIGFRQFQFDYRFYPKSQAETDQVQKIIETFAYHMHPELSEGGVYYIHPSEFNIQYYYKGKENPYFNKISTCALIDMHVNYGDENFSSFGDGAPVEITMQLTFQELETMTKDRIKQGY